MKPTGLVGGENLNAPSPIVLLCFVLCVKEEERRVGEVSSSWGFVRENLISFVCG